MCTSPKDKVTHDTLDVLSDIVLEFFDRGCEVRLWKRDVSQAFRRVPIKADQLEFAWGVWAHQGVLWVAQHLATQFGTIGAVYSWHRVGYLLKLLIARLFLVPASRYVDDFFGANRAGVALTGGVVLSILASLLGFPCDEGKDSDHSTAMTVLGALRTLSFADRVLFTRVDLEKAAKYQRQLREMLTTQVCTPGDASKLAGRLSFSVSVSGNRVGRAYIKPFFAQANAPLPRNQVSPRMAQSADWFLQYLENSPASARSSCKGRPQCVSWSDAAGPSRWVAAIVSVEGAYLWTRMQTPPDVWTVLLDRGDNQIGFQELLGVLHVWGTFSSLLAESCWVAFVDNNSVLHALMNGGGGGPEAYACIGRLWLDLAEARVDLHLGRVESASNPADGPTRDRFEVLQRMKAQWVPPCLPPWVHTMWQGQFLCF